MAVIRVAFNQNVRKRSLDLLPGCIEVNLTIVSLYFSGDPHKSKSVSMPLYGSWGEPNQMTVKNGTSSSCFFSACLIVSIGISELSP